MARRKYSSNLSFVDLLFNLLVGFASLFFLAFLLINPVADEGKIDPVTQFMITLTWPDESVADIDLWIRGPDGQTVSFVSKEGGYMQLDRDDLGTSNDTYFVNGKQVIVERNLETITINAIVPGEYTVSVFYYGGGPIREDGGKITYVYTPTTVEASIIDMHPFRVNLTRKLDLIHRVEQNVASFVVTEDGQIYDVRTDIKVPIVKSANARPMNNFSGRPPFDLQVGK